MVRGLPPQTQEQSIRDFFATCGDALARCGLRFDGVGLGVVKWENWELVGCNTPSFEE